MKYVPAEFNKSAFHCLFSNCGTYAKQSWAGLYWVQAHPVHGGSYHAQVPDLVLAVCEHCGQCSIWFKTKLIFPAARTAPAPHPETPESIKADYEEARAVFGESPRSSAALLRLCVQKLCITLGQPGKNLNDDIGELVIQGLPVIIQRSLDIVRVIGNNQVHPGVLDVRDDPAMVTLLFELVNLIVEDRIARPKQIEALYGKLPEGARKQIESRDEKVKS